MARSVGSLQYLGHTQPTGDFDAFDKFAPQTELRVWDNGNTYDHLERVQRCPLGGAEVLFIIERDINRNTCLYRLRRGDDQGGPRASPPLCVYWLMFGNHEASDVETNQPCELSPSGFATETWSEELTPLESKLAYSVQPASPRTLERVGALRPPSTVACVEVVACKGMCIFIAKEKTNAACAPCRYVALVPIEGRLYQLQRILLHTAPQMFPPWPRVVQMDIETKDEHGLLHQFHYITK